MVAHKLNHLVLGHKLVAEGRDGSDLWLWSSANATLSPARVGDRVKRLDYGKRGDGRKSSLPDACCVMFSSWT
ncbi:hypothetical protein KCU87_g368, partial [Aureobasidium melanogenum]